MSAVIGRGMLRMKLTDDSLWPGVLHDKLDGLWPGKLYAEDDLSGMVLIRKFIHITPISYRDVGGTGGDLHITADLVAIVTNGIIVEKMDVKDTDGDVWCEDGSIRKGTATWHIRELTPQEKKLVAVELL